MRLASFFWSPESLLKKSRVPDLAMVPRLAMTSSRLMPMPLSAMVSVLASLSKPMRILKSESPSNSPALCSASKRSLSQASDALETSSLRNISRLEYSEWIIRCSSCLGEIDTAGDIERSIVKRQLGRAPESIRRGGADSSRRPGIEQERGRAIAIVEADQGA